MRLLSPVLLVVLVGAGCTGGLFSERDRLKTALEEFNEGLRWGKVDAAASHLTIPERQPFAERFGAVADDLEIVEYEVQRIQWNREKGTAEVRLSLSWSSKRRGLVDKTILEQHWEDVHGGWFVTRQKRLSGTPLPLLDIGIGTLDPVKK